ncbi:hypothetical protein V1519DRAFT_448091 [Lipomyces tetrasporus]
MCLQKQRQQRRRRQKQQQNAQQKRPPFWNSWIGTSRWTYNEFPKSKKALRARAINKEAAEMPKKPWLVRRYPGCGHG